MSTRNQVQDGPSCSGCGLSNYEGLCPHCRGDEAEFNEMMSRRVPPLDDDFGWDDLFREMSDEF